MGGTYSRYAVDERPYEWACKEVKAYGMTLKKKRYRSLSNAVDQANMSYAFFRSNDATKPVLFRVEDTTKHAVEFFIVTNYDELAENEPDNVGMIEENAAMIFLERMGEIGKEIDDFVFPATTLEIVRRTPH